MLVTGAAGFLGRAVVRRLVMDDHDVAALVHRHTESFPSGVDVVQGDVLHFESLRAALGGTQAVCHLAGLTRTRESLADPLRYFQVNTVGTSNLLQALADRGADATTPRVVFMSTCAVYGDPGTQPISEHTPPNPLNPYGQSKLAAEYAVAAQARTGAIGAVIVRTFNAAGAVDGITDPDRTRIIPKAIAVAAGRSDVLYVNGDGSAVREFVHVDDLAAAVVSAVGACQAGQCRTYNVGSGTGVSLRDIVAAVGSVAGRPVPVEHRPPVPEPQVLVSDTGLVRRELGWRPGRSDLQSIVEDAWRAQASTISA